MPNAASLGMIELDDLENPISFRFHCGGGSGSVAQEITVNAIGLEPGLEILTRFAGYVWYGSVALATTTALSVIFTEAVVWKAGPATLLVPASGMAGRIPGPSGTEDSAGVLTLHTDHVDKYARRQLYVPNIPRAWRGNRVLSDTGQQGMYRLAAVMAMGFGLDQFSGPTPMLIHYTDVVERSPSNILGVAFRRVHHIRVHNYCEEPPPDDNLLWP